ncbi:TATA box-binding protein-associated factor RNA polymerase I subunit A-like isoform X2 [Ctenopharyngodon idella]|uniref:TATA box-binding protein-associated factor RNA polymerase I subunit A-like isoform X2 n=1 Tax=Ctenopharyngodon idella TaxID=7959 RepID=UPI0022316835|nr:TATA box-binding protein-associated factor RNA polymerase I subunit A-like isoform X2 [Ctenopharyngodon idella]
MMLQRMTAQVRNGFKCLFTSSIRRTRKITWRIGTEILRHLPNSNAEDFSAVNEQLKYNGVTDFSKICLEHSFHLLLNGQMDEAKRQLSIRQSWRRGNISIAQGDTKKLIQAYCGFLDYLIWCKKKSSVPGTDEASSNHEIHSCFRQASVTLKEIISQPGIWDPFVLSYIDMLEFYNDEDGALEILENYAYNKDFPINPNAHVYLYHFLKRHNAPEAKLIGSLMVLRTLVPSHELMLELCSLLLRTSQMSDLEDAFSISMDLLEFSSWKCDIKAWSCLLNIMKILKQKKCKETIKKEWKSRRPLWFPLHFRSYISKKDIVENISLVKVKREVLKIVGEYSSVYNKMALEFEIKFGSVTEEYTLRKNKKMEKVKKMMEKEKKKREKEKMKMEKEKEKMEREKLKMEKKKLKMEKRKLKMEKKKMEKEKMEKEKMKMVKEKLKLKKVKKKMKKTKKSKYNL